MKTIPNLTFTINVSPADEEPATTATLLKATLNQAPATGFDFTTMRLRNRIADVLEKATTEIAFEDADFVAARKCVEDFRWAASHPDLLKFAELFGL